MNPGPERSIVVREKKKKKKKKRNKIAHVLLSPVSVHVGLFTTRLYGVRTTPTGTYRDDRGGFFLPPACLLRTFKNDFLETSVELCSTRFTTGNITTARTHKRTHTDVKHRTQNT